MLNVSPFVLFILFFILKRPATLPVYSSLFYFRVTNNFIFPCSRKSRAYSISIQPMTGNIFLIRAINKVIKFVAKHVRQWLNLFLQSLILFQYLFSYMFPEHSEDFFILFNSITCPSFANANIISYDIYVQLVDSKENRCSQGLHTGGYFLSFQFKLNLAFFDGQLLVISS